MHLESQGQMRDELSRRVTPALCLSVVSMALCKENHVSLTTKTDEGRT